MLAAVIIFVSSSPLFVTWYFLWESRCIDRLGRGLHRGSDSGIHSPRRLLPVPGPGVAVLLRHQIPRRHQRSVGIWPVS